jgi:hypothetical protein
MGHGFHDRSQSRERNCGSFQAGQLGIANRSVRRLDRIPREPGPIIVALTRAR